MTLGDFIKDSNKQLEEYAGLNKDYEVCHSNENLIEHIKIFLNIVKGLNFIHSHDNMIHRDIKPNNILFTLDNKIKISDFGLATNNKINNPGFMLPSPICSKRKLQSELRLDSHMIENGLCQLGKKVGFGIISPIHTDKNLIIVKTESLNDASLKRLQSIDNKFQKQKQDKKTNMKKKEKEKEKEKENIIEEIYNENYHTKEVGTTTYSAPEQLNNNLYDQKVYLKLFNHLIFNSLG